MQWSLVDFGKFAAKPKSLPQILFDDPDWFFWAIESDVFKTRPGLQQEARLLNDRARRIRPSGAVAPDPVVEYFLHLPSRKFGGMHVVPRSQQAHEGASPTLRKDFIDLSVPRQFGTYDKLGCKTLVREMKEHLFGSKSTRITRERAEQFFGDSANFR